MPRFTVESPDRLLAFLRRANPDWKTGTLKSSLRDGRVLVNGKIETSGGRPLAAGDEVELTGGSRRHDDGPAPGLVTPPLPLLYFDPLLLAVDKPSGLLSVADAREKNRTAVRLMREWLASSDPEAAAELHAAHRLDRDASGVLLFARSLEVRSRLTRAWRGFRKIYLAVVDGRPDSDEGTIDVPLYEDRGLFVRVGGPGRGEPAETHYKTLETGKGRSLLEVEIVTGRKHQIRVHLASIGCPVAGDLRYGVSKAPRLALHAKRLTLSHPSDGRLLDIESAVPALFRGLLLAKPT